MFDNLTALGWGVVTFAITIGIGTTVLAKFGGAIASCQTGFTYEGNGTSEVCANDTNTLDGDYTPISSGWTNTNYLNGQLGQSGLAGWAPAIIAFSVGMLFLGAFIIGKGKGRSY